MSDSDCESANEYTALMDAHVGEVRPDIAGDRTSRKRRPPNHGSVSGYNRSAVSLLNLLQDY